MLCLTDVLLGVGLFMRTSPPSFCLTVGGDFSVLLTGRIGERSRRGPRGGDLGADLSEVSTSFCVDGRTGDLTGRGDRGGGGDLARGGDRPRRELVSTALSLESGI